MTNLILSYYKGSIGQVLDVTYGVGTFWKKKLPNWVLNALDKEPTSNNCLKSTWEELNGNLYLLYDAIFVDPPYSRGKGGFDLDQTSGYKRMKRSAAFTDSMKYGTGNIPKYLAETLSKYIQSDGILVVKNQEFTTVHGFELYDYLIQDNGFQPDGFKLTKPKARPNHAFWMIFKKSNFSEKK